MVTSFGKAEKICPAKQASLSECEGLVSGCIIDLRRSGAISSHSIKRSLFNCETGTRGRKWHENRISLALNGQGKGKLRGLLVNDS